MNMVLFSFHFDAEQFVNLKKRNFNQKYTATAPSSGKIE